ncbi:MAG: hypothetical protein AAGH82_02675 [Pseudomonadota bacterium]
MINELCSELQNRHQRELDRVGSFTRERIQLGHDQKILQTRQAQLESELSAAQLAGMLNRAIGVLGRDMPRRSTTAQSLADTTSAIAVSRVEAELSSIRLNLQFNRNRLEVVRDKERAAREDAKSTRVKRVARGCL